MLLLLQAPVVDIPKGSWANRLLANSRSVREPRGLAAWGGYGDLRRHLLPQGDEEVRVWDGFGITNLGGLILRRKGGAWTAVRLIGGIPGTKFRSRKIGYAVPKSGWPLFWRKADALWTLPDDSTLPQKDREVVLDGFSYLVETQRNGHYRAYAYDNPDDQRWPEAKRMAALGRMLDAEFPI